jgi:hypothetical protein
VKIILIAPIAFAFFISSQASGVKPECALSNGTKRTALALSWDEFDQKGENPASMRWLANHECIEEAAALAEYYVANKPDLTDKQRRNSHFHIGQLYGVLGDYTKALAHVKVSVASDQPAAAPLDWNTYVAGVLAFFARDRAALQAARGALSTRTEAGNVMNTGALARMDYCFDRPYSAIFKPECDPLPGQK